MHRLQLAERCDILTRYIYRAANPDLVGRLIISGHFPDLPLDPSTRHCALPYSETSAHIGYTMQAHPLPSDVWIAVLQYLSVADLAHLSQTSRYFHALVRVHGLGQLSSC